MGWPVPPASTTRSFHRDHRSVGCWLDLWAFAQPFARDDGIDSPAARGAAPRLKAVGSHVLTTMHDAALLVRELPFRLTLDNHRPRARSSLRCRPRRRAVRRSEGTSGGLSAGLVAWQSTAVTRWIVWCPLHSGRPCSAWPRVARR